MSGEWLVFMLLSLLAITGGMSMINLTKVMHMVLALVFTFLSLAGLYIMLSAEFVGAVQILIYSGAITIIMIFGIMLTKHNAEEESQKFTLHKALSLISVIAIGVVLYFAVRNVDFNVPAAGLEVENTKQIGISLFSYYIIPFELMSILLLVAFVGAIILARRDDEKGE